MSGVRESAEALIEQYHLSGDEAIRERLIAMHLNVAAIVARRFSGRGVDYDDLYQVASLALVKAIDRFNPAMGLKFTTFLAPTMAGEVKNYFRDRSRLISIPRSGAELMKKIKAATEHLEQKLMRNPTPVELAEYLNAPVEAVLEALEMRESTSYASLDSASEEDESPISTFIGKNEEGFEKFETSDMLKRALDKLPDDEKKVMIYRYIQALSQREVAQKTGVSQMTVSRIERRAISKLKALLAPERNDS
ncbi:MAG: sigma-70 family RNA polymerase sigma factor [Clostridia bacterium]|nr:sigma-70 family RNA polymerase sigma factor [Clostridia bacterium]